MTPTGWQIRHTDAPFDPWVASNLETGETVFGRDLGDIALQVPMITVEVDTACIARLDAIAAEHRKSVGEARWAELNREWL